MKVREGGRVVSTHLPVATGVNADGHREILGIDVCAAESEAGAHSGLVAAVVATWKVPPGKGVAPTRRRT